MPAVKICVGSVERDLQRGNSPGPEKQRWIPGIIDWSITDKQNIRFQEIRMGLAAGAKVGRLCLLLPVEDKLQI